MPKIMPKMFLVLLVALAPGTLSENNLCADPANFNGDATANVSGVPMPCNDANAVWIAQRALAASDAAACDAIYIKVTMWTVAATCCGGADDSVSGVAPNICADSANFNGEATRQV